MDEEGEINAGAVQELSARANLAVPADEAIDVSGTLQPSDSAQKSSEASANPFMSGEIRTLDGDIAGDEFAADAINYQVLLGKIDTLLEKLKLDA